MVVARGSWMWTALLGSLTAAVACTCSTPGDASDAAGPQPAAVAPSADAKAAAPATPELSEEDRRLIAADPKDLSPDDRRKRAYALRRKIMQNPDSPAARTLEDLRKATDEGLLQPPGGGPHFEVRRTADVPASAPPAGTRTDTPPSP